MELSLRRNISLGEPLLGAGRSLDRAGADEWEAKSVFRWVRRARLIPLQPSTNENIHCCHLVLQERKLRGFGKSRRSVLWKVAGSDRMGEDLKAAL